MFLTHEQAVAAPADELRHYAVPRGFWTQVPYGEAGTDDGLVWLPAEDGRRRRPPAGPALKFVEKLLTTNLTSTDTTERNAGMLRLSHRRIAGRVGYWFLVRVALVLVVAAQTEAPLRCSPTLMDS